MGIETITEQEIDESESFLYARYMGIETNMHLRLLLKLPFLYARYMGIETGISDYCSYYNCSCTLAIWVLKPLSLS